jgi:hypothetical protein
MGHPMKRRTQLLMIGLFTLLAMLLGGLLFSQNMASSRFASAEKLLKHFVGGQVINQSNQSVTLFDWRIPHTLAAGQHSKKQAINDVDALTIDGPTLINGKLYDHGVFKFCDMATVIVANQNGMLTYTTNWGGLLCQLTQDLAVFNSIEAATPMFQ